MLNEQLFLGLIFIDLLGQRSKIGMVSVFNGQRFYALVRLT